MLGIFDNFREVNMISVTLRLVLAVICGGCIGLEREYKRRAAGFRTHILICLGAAVTMLTGEYLYRVARVNIDITRMGAQVVAGIGFIGAGCIMITRRRQIRGLTTAAGLWAAAIIGLCLGAGFYEVGLVATVLVLLAEMLFSKLERWMLENSEEMKILLHYEGREALEEVLATFTRKGVRVRNMVVTRSQKSEKPASSSVIFTLQLDQRVRPSEMKTETEQVSGVVGVEVL